MGVAGRCVGPGAVGRLLCRGSSSPLLAEGASGVVDGEGGDVMVLLMPMVLQVWYLVMPRVRVLWVVLLRLGGGVASDAVVVRVLWVMLRVLPLQCRNAGGAVVHAGGEGVAGDSSVYGVSGDDDDEGAAGVSGLGPCVGGHWLVFGRGPSLFPAGGLLGGDAGRSCSWL